ncbi:MAG: exosortase/archaeosortase family protein [Verrucomicrobiota bacterium]
MSFLQNSKEFYSKYSLLFLPLSLVLWVAWICADDWNNNENYSYGWLILPLSFFFLWRRIQERASSDPVKSGEASTLWFVPIPLGIFLLELVRLTPISSRLITWLVFSITAYTSILVFHQLWKRQGVSYVVFPLLLLSTAIPWPTFLEINIIRHFSFAIASTVGELLLLSGIFCKAEGTIIQLSNGLVGVSETCSGLRSLQASVMVGLATGEWFYLSNLRRVLLILLSVFTALFTNLVRTYVLCYIVASSGEGALERWHDTAGLVAMLSLTLIISGIAYVLSTNPPVPSKPSPVIEFFRSLKVQGSTKWVFGVCFICFLFAHTWFFIHDYRNTRFYPFFTESSWQSADVGLVSAPKEVNDILRSDEGGYLISKGPHSQFSIGYHFFWKPARTNGKVFFHRPDVCMPGGGWTQEGNAQLIPGMLNGRPAVIHRFTFSKGPIHSNLYWTCWVDDNPVKFSGSPSANLQLSFIPEFIRLGQRIFSVEILAIMSKQPSSSIEDITNLYRAYGNLDFQPSS